MVEGIQGSDMGKSTLFAYEFLTLVDEISNNDDVASHEDAIFYGSLRVYFSRQAATGC